MKVKAVWGRGERRREEWEQRERRRNRVSAVYDVTDHSCAWSNARRHRATYTAHKLNCRSNLQHFYSIFVKNSLCLSNKVLMNHTYLVLEKGGASHNSQEW
jgi:hypothetical protein